MVKRGLFLFLKTLAVLLVIVVSLGIWARFIEPKTLIVRHFDVKSAAWTGAPLNIVVLSDTHVGGVHVDARRVGRIMEKVRRLSPDIVLLVGDYVGGHEPMEERTAAFQQEIRASLQAMGSAAPRYGTYAILGNHDWWYDEGEVRAQLTEAGIVLLDNNVTTISLGNEKLQLAGIGDITTDHAVPALIEKNYDPKKPGFIFTHNPDVFVGFPPIATVNFAGHTHGGQVWLPFVGRPGVPSDYGQRFARGRYEDDAGTILVTSGIGTSLLPIRFMTPPEIMVVRVSRP